MEQLRISEVIQKLYHTRSLVSELDAPSSPGLYACFVRNPSVLRPLQPGPNGLIYVGKAENLAKREFANHFNDRGTGSSTLRRSLGAILKQRLGLTALPRGSGRTAQDFSCYRFDPVGEARLTAWMREQLEVAVYAVANPAEIENHLIKSMKPLLNLIDWDNPDRPELKKLRKACADEARGHSAEIVPVYLENTK